MSGAGWKKVAAIVARLGAPVLGGAVGGTPGAGAGRIAGKIIASALGVGPDPEEILAQLDAGGDPETVASLRQAELDHKAEILSLQIEAERSDLSQVNETMRAELASGNWYQKGWRPTFGYITAVCYGAILLGVAKVLWTGGDPELIGALGAITVFMSVGLSVLGVTAYRRTTEKNILAGAAEQGGLMAAFAERIRKGEG